MNLNFIQDDDKVYVESQNQNSSKQEIILKLKLLRQDFDDYEKLNQSMKTLNQTFSNLIKTLFNHVSTLREIQQSQIDKKNISESPAFTMALKKKPISIPYGIVKKIDQLKVQIQQSTQVLNQQIQNYKQSVINRDNEKATDVKFYKKILHSYEAKRKNYKKETLQLEERIQAVEKQIKQYPQQLNHSHTDYKSNIMEVDYLRIYEKKISAWKRVQKELRQLKKVRTNLKKVVNHFPNIGQVEKSKKEESQSFAKTLNKPLSGIVKTVLLKQHFKEQFFSSIINDISKRKNQSKIVNSKLKEAIARLMNDKYFYEMKANIQKSLIELNPGSIDKKDTNNLKGKNRITKTDYIIFLKELVSRISQNQESIDRYVRISKVSHSNSRIPTSLNSNLMRRRSKSCHY